MPQPLWPSMELIRPGRDGHGQILTKLFDHLVEPQLIHPTFVTGYPTEVSPLSRRNDQNPIR